MKKVTTAVFVRRGDEILLGFKKRGFGMGRWDGFGGKVESNEAILQGAKRELLEESGLTAETLQAVAQMTFDYEHIPDEIENTVFVCDDFSGVPKETEEMRPEWFKANALPYDLMWPDERIWLPIVLSGKKFKAAFHYQDFDHLSRYTLDEVS